MQKQENIHKQSFWLATLISHVPAPILVQHDCDSSCHSAEQLTYLISTDIFMCGVASFLQLNSTNTLGLTTAVLGVAFQLSLL